MKIAILSRNENINSTRRLVEAARARGHDVQVLDTLKFSFSIEGEAPQLYYESEELTHYEAVIPRIGASITFFGCSVVRHLEQMGVFTLNSSHAIAVSRDKLRCLQLLSRHDIGMPATAFARDRKDVLPAIKRVGGAPVIIKVLEGTQGAGVILAETDKIAEAIVETLQTARQNVLIQKFVAESKGRDIRAFVVGDRVVAAMRRSASEGEYRSNVHRGGKTEKVELTEEYQRTAIRACQIVGLRVAGVDMLESSEGPKILEINSSPGLTGIEAATGVDIATEIIKLTEDACSFPDLDLRQRLTLQSGYGVAEFPITPGSSLEGKTIETSGLREHDVLVLSITRQGMVMPNPAGGRELLAGDVLLCFGKLATLKSFVPPSQPRPKKRKKSG